jgi:nucleotide-binding universal stress UspA family protein
MIRAIMFPTDFSAVANSALPLATVLAQKLNAPLLEVHIMHGGDPHVTETTRYEFPSLPDWATDVQLGHAMIPKGPNEDPAEVLMRTARERDCDLIVMASHGRSDVAQFFLGRSVAERVARESQIPAIVVRLYGARRTTRPIDRLARLLYATDLSKRSRAILPYAAAIARATGARLDTLLVFGEGDVVPLDIASALAQHFAAAEASDLLRAPQVIEGGIAESVVSHLANEQFDLIACTTTLGSGGDPRADDMADYIIRNAPCPVLCLKP